ncbi:MAG: hypothetical protein HY860_05560 [Chlamydiales bacterium]|nr:hypothetical protein [Chlamydiales bacterium]
MESISPTNTSYYPASEVSSITARALREVSEEKITTFQVAILFRTTDRRTGDISYTQDMINDTSEKVVQLVTFKRPLETNHSHCCNIS